MFFGILMFVFREGSRRKANANVNTPTLLENFKILFPELETIPHTDTIDRFLRQIKIEELEEITISLIKRFIKKKKFLNYLINKHYPIAIDGTGLHYFGTEKHCDHCLHKKINGNNVYFHNTLEAVIVFSNGIRLPILSECIENQEEYLKQDCELKSFYRLAMKLRKYFPKLKILLLLDGLYPNGPLFEYCRKNRFDFMINWKDGNLKSVWDDFNPLKESGLLEVYKKTYKNKKQVFTVMNNKEYVYKNAGQEKLIKIHLVECIEHWPEEINKEIIWKEKKFAWVSNKQVTYENFHERCNLGARHRWDIEEEILIEKRHGYNIQHVYSNNNNAMKAYYCLLKIARIITVILEKSNVLKKVCNNRSQQGFINFVKESFKTKYYQIDYILKSLTKKHQIRFE